MDPMEPFDPSKRKVITSRELYQSPEFKALCEKLGIAWGFPTLDMAILLPLGGNVTVVHEYQCRKTVGDGLKGPDDPRVIETTNEHNETYRTYEPRKD